MYFDFALEGSDLVACLYSIYFLRRYTILSLMHDHLRNHTVIINRKSKCKGCMNTFEEMFFGRIDHKLWLPLNVYP